MSAIDQLMGALRSAEGALAALGPKPKGDVAGMQRLAALLRTEAGTVAEQAGAAGHLPGSIEFVGPGRADIEGNAGLVAGVALGAARELEAAAERVAREASKIDRAQREWEHNHRRLQDAIAGLGAQIRGAGR